MTSYKVFISHPERQHSHELATALAQTENLGHYVHGAPLPGLAVQSIARAHRSRVGFCRIMRRILRTTAPTRLALENYYRLIWSFDRLMAKRIKNSQFDAVIGYENAALHQFKAAKLMNMRCILDNSGIHHATQDAALPYEESADFHRRIVSRKEAELALADMILVCSTFARDSFIAGGVSPQKLRILPLGCDIQGFSPKPKDRLFKNEERVRFLFVGRLSRLKGADLVAEATRQLKEEGIEFSMDVIAPIGEAESGLVEAFTGIARLHNKIPYERLPEFHAQADCLVLPSRFDSFAFVVAEGLASGLPVIVSETVGAKDLIVEHENGWIIPSGDAQALLHRMRWCALHRAELRSMSTSARNTAEEWDWKKYRSSVSQVVDDFMQTDRSVRS